MTWRDTPFEASSNLVVVGPLTADALAKLPARFTAWARSPLAAPFRFGRAVPGARWRPVPASRLPDATARAIVRLPDGLQLEGIEAAARALDYPDLGAILLLSSSYAGVTFAHAFGDGTVAIGSVRAILSGEIADVTPTVRVPTLRGLAGAGRLSPAGLRAGRGFLRRQHPLLEAAPRAGAGALTDPATLAISEFDVRADRVSELARAVRASTPAGSRVPTSTAIVSSLLFRAARACLLTDADLPIRMLVGLRKFLPDGRTAPGNFAGDVLVGSLRGRDWTPAAVLDDVLPLIASPDAMAGYAVEALIRLRHPRRAPTTSSERAEGSPLMLTYNIITGGMGVSDDDYVSGAAPRPALVMLNRGPVLGPHCTVGADGKRFVITTVDDAQVLDLPRLEAAFRAEEQALLSAPPPQKTSSRT